MYKQEVKQDSDMSCDSTKGIYLLEGQVYMSRGTQQQQQLTPVEYHNPIVGVLSPHLDYHWGNS